MTRCSNEDLQRIALLSGLGDAERQRVGAAFQRRRVGAGDMLLQFGAPSTEVYVLLEGELVVAIESPDGRAVIYRDFKAGEVIGDFGAIEGESRTANVYATTDATVAVIGADAFRQLLADHPAVAAAEMRHLVAVIRNLTRRIYQLSTQAALDRLKAELLRLGEPLPGQPYGWRLSPIPTQQDLAARTGSHREAVSRHLNQLERDGLIVRDRGSLTVPDRRRLFSGDPVADPPSRPAV